MASELFKEKDADLGELVEEMLPFTSEFMHDIVTIVDEDDLKEWDQYSEESLLERYHAAIKHIKQASPPST